MTEFPADQVGVLVVGIFVPLVAYVLNYFAPWVDEKVKGVVTVVLAAVASSIYQAIEVGNFGWNNTTLQLVLTGIIGALGAHTWFYRPSGISTAAGGGRNKQSE